MLDTNELEGIFGDFIKRLAERILPREGEHSDVHENPDWQDDWLARLLGVGDGAVEWTRCLEGKFIQIAGDCRSYEILRVLPPVSGISPPLARLKLVDVYEGTTEIQHLVIARELLRR